MNSSDVLIYILVMIIFIILGYIITKHCIVDNVAPFVSDYDGKNYDIRRVGDSETKQTAANYLAMISAKVDKLVDFMHKNNLPDADVANRLYSRWNKCELKETSSSDKSAAYTLNKSSEIRLCIRTFDGGFEDPNTSMFVILHELSHQASISFGHNDEFKNNFSYITHLASSLGLYKPEDFKNNPKSYCNVEINTSPCSQGSCEFNTIKL